MKKILLVSLSKNFGGIERLFHNLFVNNVKDYHLDIITFHEKCAYQEDFENEGYTESMQKETDFRRTAYA